MTLSSMRFHRRKWRPFRDESQIVHHATRLTKKEAEYLFRLADMTRVLVPCGACMAKIGEVCVSKFGCEMHNHSVRVTHARALVKAKYAPLFDRVFEPLCTTVDSSRKLVVFVPADGHEVDCMACLVIATMAGSKG